MKREVTLEASAEPDSGVLLLAACMALCDFRLNPESLVWSYFREKKEVRVWIVVDDTEIKLKAFVECCRSLPGARYVADGPAEDRSRVLARIHELESRSPFVAPADPLTSAKP